jgi:hypothetical protein
MKRCSFAESCDLNFGMPAPVRLAFPALYRALHTTSPDCNFKKGYGYYIGAYEKHNTGSPQTDKTTPSQTTRTISTTTSTPSNGIYTPMPIQSGMVTNYNKSHPIKTITSYEGITDYNKISISNFFKWNPRVNSDYSNLSLGANTCGGIIGSISQPISTKQLTTTTSNGISTPPSIQSGMVSNCNKFHIIKTTTTCQGTVDYDKITITNLLKWNTSIDTKCNNLKLLSALSVAPLPPRFVYVSGRYFSDGQNTDDEIMDLLRDSDGYCRVKLKERAV